MFSDLCGFLANGRKTDFLVCLVKGPSNYLTTLGLCFVSCCLDLVKHDILLPVDDMVESIVFQPHLYGICILYVQSQMLYYIHTRKIGNI